MKLSEIKQAIESGHNVHWVHDGYDVIKDKYGYLICFKHNQSCIGLTHRDGITLNGKESEFYIS
mgnify:CR=1 FL=1|jgi:hypothetical protein